MRYDHATVAKRRPVLDRSAAFVAVPASAAFVGAGDIATFAAWWGLRGYNAAYNTGSNPAIDVVDHATGLITTTINIKTDGTLDTAAIAALGYAVDVSQIYDQTGGGQHLSQVTHSQRPAYSATNGPGGGPCLIFDHTANQELLGSINATLTQPASAAGVVNRTGNTTNFNTWASSDNFELLFTDSVNTLGIYAGAAVVSLTANDNAWHAQQALFNGASSSTSIDGSSAGGNAGSPSSGTAITLGSHAGSSDFAGRMVEFGWMTGNQSANFSALNSNAHSFWGF